MNQHLQSILNFLQQDNSLSAEEKSSIIKSLKDADKEFEITSFKLDRTEKVKRTTAILLEETIEELEQKRKAVETQNRELEIESSLERVRTVAMSMNKPDDMLDVCKIISHQLELLAVKEIRNVQTAIFYKEKGTYMNYEYYTKHDKTFITETTYNNNEKHAEFAENMQKGNGEFFELNINGNEVKEWINYQKTTNVFIDDFLYNAPSLNYYWFSLGSVALGISTYQPLKETDFILFKRFLKVFELAYRRYLDIEQAEAQAREATIEAALEKARSRSLAVHKSDEFSEVVTVVFEKLLELKLPAYSASINIKIDGSKDFNVHGCGVSENGLTTLSYRLPYFNHPILEDLIFAHEGGIDYFSKTYPSNEKNSFYEYEIIHSELKNLPADVKDKIFKSHDYTISAALAKNSMILINDFEGKGLDEKQADILKRFARVFEQAYIRFLDLQKAEAQAREAQIELGLERVRARAMAMQKSQELAEVATLLFKQVSDLGIKIWTTGFKVWRDDNNFFTDYVTNPQGGFIEPYTIDSTQYPVFVEVSNAKKRGDEFFVNYEEGEQLAETYRKLSKYGEKQFKVILDSGFQFPSKQYEHHVFGSKVSLMFITYEPVPEAHDIFKRFGKVFEQTYTRFLDLQKAEAQAREAKIELALERVRSRSMAMYKSEEVMDVAVTVYDELQKLDFKFGAATIIIMDKETGYMEHWLAGFIQKNHVENYPVNNIEHPLHAAQLAAWRKGEKFVSIELSGAALKAYAEEMFMETGYKNLPDEEKLLLLSNENAVFNLAYMSHGALMWAPSALSDEKTIILQRFAKVFEQTYTRFLDLQKAEAQAREATIETALERVRSRTMGMQKSEELKEIIRVVYEQFVHLNILVEHAGFIMDYKARDDMNIWLADKHEVPFQVTIPYFNCAHWNSFNEAKEKGLDFFANHLSFEEKNKFYQDLFELFPVPDEAKEYYFSCPGLAISTVLLDNVGLYIENFSGASYSDEENNTLMRFGKVFQQTYTRFLDLQKAEAQAREAQIEAALERVRSKAMAMQKSEDLADAVAIVFEELNKLNMGILRCGIGILDKNKRTADVFTTTISDNNSIMQISGDVPMNIHPLFNNAFEAWLKQQDCEYVLKGKDLNNYYKALTGVSFKLPQSQSLITADERLCQYYYNAIFSYGGLFAYSDQPVNDEARKILKRFANVFEQTYTRFLDIKKAEAQTKEAQIETALERVRSRTLAMQNSDELAETAAVLFKQLIILGIEPNRLYINIIKNETGEAEFWITDEDGSKVSMAYEDNMSNNPSFKKMFDGWKQQKKSLVIDMKGKELQQYFNYLSSIHVPFKGGLTQKRRLQYIAYFNKGFIGMASPDEQPAETLQLLERFAYVLNLTFTRFSDLQIAEAHAVQAEQDLIAIKTAKQKAENALNELQITQRQLIQSEKMASLGELTAGIAHEIQNPLNFVNNFSEVNTELIDEMKEEWAMGNGQQAIEIADDVKENLEKILHHGKRADAIVKGMLQHSRKSEGIKELTDINVLCDEYLRLSFHGLRAKEKSFNAVPIAIGIKTDFGESIGKINIVPQDIGRVLLNLFNNAFYTVSEKLKAESLKQEEYKPLVSIQTKRINDKVEIVVKDNGNGIPQNIIDKIFQPFFTTKPTGQGTGLGLSLAYDIITKEHNGTIKVESKESEGSEFIIALPY